MRRDRKADRRRAHAERRDRRGQEPRPSEQRAQRKAKLKAERKAARTRQVSAIVAAAVVLAPAPPAAATTSTSYCLRGTMADGSYTRAGSAAHNGLALGTRITVRPAPFGRSRWVVRDRIGWGTDVDFWAPSCGQAMAYGRRAVSVTVGWARSRVLVGRLRRPAHVGLPEASCG